MAHEDHSVDNRSSPVVIGQARREPRPPIAVSRRLIFNLQVVEKLFQALERAFQAVEWTNSVLENRFRLLERPF